MSAFRVPQGGRGINRSREITFSVDGESYRGFAGDTVASALLAAGRIACGDSLYLGRPRGVMTAGVEEPNALLRVQPRFTGDISESMLPATTVDITEGLEASTLSGLGVLDPQSDQVRYEHKHLHADVLVIGAGPAGVAAAREAAKGGARTILMDERSVPGGSLLGSSGEQIDGLDALDWVNASIERLAGSEEFTYLPRTTAMGSYDSNFVTAVEDRTQALIAAADGGAAPAGQPRQRIWHVRAKRLLLATGAHERPIVFANNDRPGIMLAGAVRHYLHRYGVAAGSHAVVATTNDSAYALVDELHAAGIQIAAVVDSRVEASAQAQVTLDRTGVRGIFGAAIGDTSGGADGALSAVTVVRLDASGLPVDTEHGATGCETIGADLLAVSGGFSPVVQLHTQRQGRVVWSDEIAGFRPVAPVAEQAVVGAGNGDYSLASALRGGAEAGHQAAHATGYAAPLIVPEASGKATQAARCARSGSCRVRAERLVNGVSTSSTCNATRPSLMSTALPVRG